MALWPISSRAMAAPVWVPTLERSDLASPPGLEGLRELAENLWWSWHPEARRLFARIDPQTWARTRNPIPLLRHTDVDRWAVLAADRRFVADTASLAAELAAYLDDPTPGIGDDLGGPVAYLCAEFALQESLPVYSGGLGVLAGDRVQDRLRRPAAHGRRGAVLPPGLLPAADRRGGAPGAPRAGRRPGRHPGPSCRRRFGRAARSQRRAR